MVAALNNTEAVGDEGGVGVGSVGRGVAAGAVVVGVGGRLVHENAAGQVDRQRDLGAPGGFGHRLDHFRAGRIDARGQCAVGSDDAFGKRDVSRASRIHRRNR